MAEYALLFQPTEETPARPAGLVEIVFEVKQGFPMYMRRIFVVRYTCPWMGGATSVAAGDELQIAL